MFCFVLLLRNISVSSGISSGAAISILVAVVSTSSIGRNGDMLRRLRTDGIVVVRGSLASGELELNSSLNKDKNLSKEEQPSAGADLAAGRFSSGIGCAVALGVEGSEGAGPSDQKHKCGDTIATVDNLGHFRAIKEGRLEDAADGDGADDAPEQDRHDSEGGTSTDSAVEFGATECVFALVLVVADVEAVFKEGTV